MASVLNVSNAVAQAMATAIATATDAGTAALIRIYSGTMPTDTDTALSGNTLLAELPMSATAFGAATDANPGGRITAAAITSDSSADATGSATFFRIITQNAGTYILQDTVGTSGAGMNLNTTSITAGSTVACTAGTITVPEGP
jgi:hypothetical protein